MWEYGDGGEGKERIKKINDAERDAVEKKEVDGDSK